MNPDVLRRNFLFEILSPEDLRLISENGILRSLPAESRILYEGDTGDSIFLLLKGTVKIYKENSEGTQILISLIQPGGIFGEITVTGEATYPFSAESVSKAELFVISRKIIRKFLKEEAFRDRFLTSLFGRIQYMSQLIEDLSVMDTEERLFRFLYQKYGKKTVITTTMSKKDTASAIGTVPETLSRIIARLTKNKIMSWKGKEIRLATDFWDTCDYSWLGPHVKFFSAESGKKDRKLDSGQ